MSHPRPLSLLEHALHAIFMGCFLCSFCEYGPVSSIQMMERSGGKRGGKDIFPCLHEEMTGNFHYYLVYCSQHFSSNNNNSHSLSTSCHNMAFAKQHHHHTSHTWKNLSRKKREREPPPKIYVATRPLNIDKQSYYAKNNRHHQREKSTITLARKKISRSQ